MSKKKKKNPIEVLYNLQKKEALEKKKQRRKRIPFVIIIAAVVLIGYFIAIQTLPLYLFYSDKNTETHTGKVTDVYLEKIYTGYKGRTRNIAHIKLEGVDTFWISVGLLNKQSPKYDEIKETILYETVEIRTAKDDDTIVSIKHNENTLYSYEEANRNSASNRIGLALVCIIAVVFIALFLLL